MASPACAPTTAPVTTPPSSSIPMAIGSRRIARCPSSDAEPERQSKRAGVSRPFRVDASCRCLLVALLAGRIVASRRNELVINRLGEAKPLLHVGDDFNHLADQVALFVLDDFGDEVRTDRLAILVEGDFAVRRVE